MAKITAKFTLPTLSFLVVLSHASEIVASHTSLPLTANIQWGYSPDIGFEGQAYIINNDAYRLDVECGNGGGPSLAISSSKLPLYMSTVTPAQTNIDIVIDDKHYTQSFECAAKGTPCWSFGLPSSQLINAMRRGSTLVIQHSDTAITKFALAGSNVALSHLSACTQ